MKRNKITIGKMVNTIEIRKPVTLKEWDKVRSKPKPSMPFPFPRDPSDEEVLLLAKYNIAQLEPKFREGMCKYSTPIFNKSGLKEMLPEILDLISYHAVAGLQWSRVHRLLDELCISRPGLDKDPHVRKMFEILGDKPLAIKKKNTTKQYHTGNGVVVHYTTDGSLPRIPKKKKRKK